MDITLFEIWCSDGGEYWHVTACSLVVRNVSEKEAAFIFMADEFLLPRSGGIMIINHYTMKMCGWNGSIAPPFLSSTRDGREWSASRSGRFTNGETAFLTHWIGGSVGLRTGLDAIENRKFLHLRGIKSRPSLYRLSYLGSYSIFYNCID
jgi:hypothetical protein